MNLNFYNILQFHFFFSRLHSAFVSIVRDSAYFDSFTDLFYCGFCQFFPVVNDNRCLQNLYQVFVGDDESN